MAKEGKRYHVIISERAGEMLVQHARFLAQVSPEAADKLRMKDSGDVPILSHFIAIEVTIQL